MSTPIPNSTISFADGQLGVGTGAAERTAIVVAPSSLGVAGTFYSFSPAAVASVPTTIGVGPGPDAVTQHLQESGQPVLYYKPTSSVAGTNSAVVNSGGGPTVTLTQVPTDDTEVIVRITTAGVIGTSQFQYSLDGGDTWSDFYATAATFVLPNNTMLNMAAGAYILAATYTFTTTAPGMNTTNVGDALDAIILSVYDPYFVAIVGQAADASADATLKALLATKITAARAAKKYFVITSESPAVDKAGLITAMASFVSPDVIGFAGFAEIVNARSNLVQKRSSGRVLGPRLQRNPRSVHLLQSISESGIEALASVRKLVPDGSAASTGYHDEEKTPGLNAGRFSCLRSIVNVAGFFPCNGLTFAANGSDYEQIPYRMIVLDCARAWYAYSVTQLGKRIPVNATTGFIDGRFADSLEQAGEAAIRGALGRDIQAVRVTINRADDLRASPTLRATIRILVGAYLLRYDTEIGLAKSLPAAA